HALTGRGHSRELFEERCGGIVVCVDSCAREAGVPFVPNSSASQISASSLLIETTVTPNAPSLATDDGSVVIVVRARNALSTPVWATLVPVWPGSAYSSTFGFIVQCTSRCAGGTGD